MDNGIDRTVLKQGVEQTVVAYIARDQARLAGNESIETGGQVINNQDRFAVVKKLPCHVAADVAGATRDQNRHELPRSVVCARTL